MVAATSAEEMIAQDQGAGPMALMQVSRRVDYALCRDQSRAPNPGRASSVGEISQQEAIPKKFREDHQD